MIKLSLTLGIMSVITVQAQEKKAMIGNIEAGKTKSAICAACHGSGGTGINFQWPRLAGQGQKYISKQLHNFKSEKRKDPVMRVQAKNLSEQDIADLAAYFSSIKPKYNVAGVASSKEITDDLLKRGENLFRGGDMVRGVTACAACHGPSGRGIEPSGYPAISGQYSQYIAKQLTNFRVGANIDEKASTTDIRSLVYRENDNSRMMRDNAVKLTDKDIEALSNYIQGLQP
ncbi:MAG: c-type cytochrome [Ostreibacterium sp.]